MAEKSRQDAAFLEQFEPDLFWQEHGRKVLIGLAALVLIGLAAVYRQRIAAQAEEAAATELARAVEPATLQRLAGEYRGKPLGAQALLRLAAEYVETGQHKEAADAFRQFLVDFPRHEFAPAAQLGLASVLEAQGDLEGARSSYQQLLTQYPSGYTAIPAKLGFARCAEALGAIKEAQQTYEELRVMLAGTPWETTVYLRSAVLARQQVAPAAPEIEPVIEP